MRVKITYLLTASGLLSLASSVVVVVLMANFMTSSVRDDRDKAYAAADTVMNGGINSIKTDLARMRMYTQQTVALIAPQFWHTATSQQALDAWNQTLFNQWAPRLVIPGETYGFAASFLFPSGVAGTYSVQSIQAYTDQLRGGVTQSTFTWTEPATGVNTFAAFAYNNATGPLVDFSTAYQYQITISYLVSLFGKTDLYDYPYAWAAADGNPYWYLTHCTDVGNSNGVHLVTQTFQSSTGWASLMSTALRSNVAEDLYVLGTDGTVVTSTNKQVQAFITACSGNDTAFDDVTVACAGLPFTSFPHLGAPAAVVRRWMNNSITSATTEVVDDAGTNKIVRMKPLFDRDNLHLVMVYVGDRPIPDNSTLIAFSVMMTMTILTVLVNFVGVAALLHPIRRAAHDMKRLSELDFSGFRGDGERSSIAETDDVLQSSNTLVVAMESFTRYMSVDLVRHLLGENEIAAVGTRVKPIVVLFADIVGFTELCSVLSVDEVMTHLLARFFDVCTNAVLSTGGTVDKFIGDCVMAFWGAPGPHAHASTAALCSAMEIFEGLLHPELNISRDVPNTGARWRKIRLLGRDTSSESVSSGVSKPSVSRSSSVVSAFSAQAGFNGVVKSRVGINAGDAHVGNVGCEQRISYTALGDCVNASSRMEALNKQVSRGGCGILASDAVLERAHPAIVRRFVGPTLLLGKSSVVDVYSVLGIDESSVPPGPTPGDVVVDKATRGAVAAAADETQYLRSVMHHFPHLVQSFEQCEQSKRFSAAVAKIVDGYATEDVSDALRTATALSTDQPKTQLLDDLAKHGRIEQYSK